MRRAHARSGVARVGAARRGLVSCGVLELCSLASRGVAPRSAALCRGVAATRPRHIPADRKSSSRRARNPAPRPRRDSERRRPVSIVFAALTRWHRLAFAALTRWHRLGEGCGTLARACCGAAGAQDDARMQPLVERLFANLLTGDRLDPGDGLVPLRRHFVQLGFHCSFYRSVQRHDCQTQGSANLGLLELYATALGAPRSPRRRVELPNLAPEVWLCALLRRFCRSKASPRRSSARSPGCRERERDFRVLPNSEVLQGSPSCHVF